MCPQGCRQKVDEAHARAVTGNSRPRGAEYGKAECVAPTRVVTSTVRIEGGTHRRIPVKTSGPIPKKDVFAAMALHYTSNREIDGHSRYIRPNWTLTREIYGIGISAALMQALLAVMMAGVNAILEAAPADSTVLVGSFGIYYKIQQIPLFAAFGLSNTIISVLSFQYGMGEGRRALDCVRWGITDTLAVCLGLSVLLEVFARPLASLFGLTGGSNQEMIGVCATALRIASLGYCFMGVTVAVQGVLQSLEDAVRPLVLALLRLVVFVFPLAWVFSRTEQVLTLVWWTFPIAEVLTAAVAAIFLRRAVRNKLRPMAGQ